MKHTDLETKQAPSKFWAYNDARMKNIAGASHYSERQKVEAERTKLGLDLCYANKGIYINYRDNFIAIKVAGAYVKNKLELMVLEAEYTKRGYTKAVTAQGVIYRIPKA